LAESSLIVSGRFHGVVSGLSCGVPTLVHSWSHKYAAVLEDFGRPGWLANPLSVEDTLRVLDVISQDSGEGWREASAGLNRCRDEMATRVESMWQHVWGMVG
jgi:colanic acid/amylovoran biosynthesis protein